MGYDDISVYQFEIMCWLSGTYTFTVATFDSAYGNYSDHIETVGTQNTTYWTNIYTSTITCSYSEEKHNLTFSTPVDIGAGTKQAFGFEWTGLLSQSQRSTSLDLGDIYAGNSEIGITVGVGLWSNSLWFSEVMCTTVYYGCNDDSTGGHGQCTLDSNLSPVDWENVFFQNGDLNDGLTPTVDITPNYDNYTFGLEINVRSDYIVTSKYDLLESYYRLAYLNTDHEGYLPITYVLTFEQFANENGEERTLDNPGTCDNRAASSYSGYETSSDYVYDVWTFTRNPGSSELGNDDYMEYPYPNIWELTFNSTSKSSECGDVIWSTVLTFADMLNTGNAGCVNSDGNNSFTFVYDTDEDEYRLEGVLYLYLVSPDPVKIAKYESLSYDEISETSLFHSILTYPIEISFNRVATYSDVLSGSEIDTLSFRLSLLGNTIYGTSYDEDTAILTIGIRTWCPEYMVFKSEFGGFQWLYPMSANVTLISMEHVLSADGECFVTILGRCFQQYNVKMRINQCEQSSGASLDNSYLQWLSSMPANASNADDVEDWMTATGASGLNDSAIVYFDLLEFEYFESCEEFVYNVDIGSSIQFYQDNLFDNTSLISMNNPLFVFNSGTDQRLYVEIEINSLDGLVDILDMRILDVWFCSFIYNDTGISDEICFDTSLNSLETWYLYSTTTSMTDQGYMTSDDIIADDSNLVEQFSFIIPIITNTDANAFGMQINTELTLNDTSSDRRRRRRRMKQNMRMLLQVDGNPNTMRQSSGVASMSVVESSGNDDAGNNSGGDEINIFYIIIGVGCLVVIVLVGVIVYLITKQKTDAVSDEIQLSQTHASLDTTLNLDMATNA